jgi:hypothetical protein
MFHATAHQLELLDNNLMSINKVAIMLKLDITTNNGSESYNF